MLRELTDKSGMAVNVWLVLLHNTRLGMAHPDAVVRNAFDDPYFYNLCPSAPEARAYAVGLAKDVTESYPVARHLGRGAGLHALRARLTTTSSR